jgi:hypothetical protein
MGRPHIHVFALIVLALCASLLMGCSIRRDVEKPPDGTGPFPLGVSVQTDRHILRLRAVSVCAPSSRSLSQRTDTNPSSLPDTTTPDPDGMPPVSAFLVSAGNPVRANARPGYRFVDALVAIQGRTPTGTVDLTRDAVERAVVTVGGTRYALGDRSLGFTYGSPVLHDTLEFEVPQTAADAVLSLTLKDETQTVRFRLW